MTFKNRFTAWTVLRNGPVDYFNYRNGISVRQRTDPPWRTFAGMTAYRHVLFALFGASLVVSVSGAYILLPFLLIDWTYRLLRFPETYRWEKSPLDAPLLIYAGWGFLTAIYNQSVGIKRMLGAQDAFLLFFLFSRGVTAGDIKTLWKGFLAASIFAGLWGGLQVVSGVNFLPNQQTYVGPSLFQSWPTGLVHQLALRNARAVGFRSHPLTYAEGFIPAFLPLLGFLIYQRFFNVRSRRFLWWGGAGLLAMGVGLVLSWARAVWLGLLGGSLILILSLKGRVKYRALAGMGICLAALFVGSPNFRERAVSIFRSQPGGYGSHESKILRYQLWEEALQDIKEHPVIGVGLKGAKWYIFDPLKNVMKKWSEAHNIFLQSAVERGLVGVGLFVWILVLIFSRIWSLKPPWKTVFISVYIAFLIAGLTESWTGDKEIALIFWAFVGIAEFFIRRPGGVHVEEKAP
ncbi:MAG: O-antigen ligase family protein [Elusimicrobia bacterium]|nr:O-antigen ligase family protein [Candidatus Obscuribacterium magneticum]